RRNLVTRGVGGLEGEGRVLRDGQLELVLGEHEHEAVREDGRDELHLRRIFHLPAKRDGLRRIHDRRGGGEADDGGRGHGGDGHRLLVHAAAVGCPEGEGGGRRDL